MNYTIRTYGISLPPQPRGEIAAVMEARRLLWNNLVAIERKHRAAVLAIGSEAAESGEYAAAHQACEDLCSELKRRRQEVRGRGDFGELREAIREARERRKQAAIAAKAARAAARSGAKETMADLEAGRIAAVKQAYAASGLWWGNYNDVLAQFNAARSRAIKTGAELRFRRRDERRSMISILDTDPTSRHCAATVLAGTHPKLRLSMADAGRHLSDGLLRYGTDDAGDPKWATFRCRLHRPLPDGRVRRAALCVERTMGAEKWTLQVTVETPAPKERTVGRTVAVDIGWRRKDGGLRVGYWAEAWGDGMGQDRHGAIVVPVGVESALDKSDDLRAICEAVFQESKGRFLAAWKACEPNLPVEINAKLRDLHIPLWRSGRKLARLFRSWVPVPGDAAIQDAIRLPVHEGRDFATQYQHLARWEVHGRAKAIRNRRDNPTNGYRAVAARILSHAHTLVMEKFDLRGMATKPKPEEDGSRPVPQRQRATAASSELRAALLNYARREGVTVIEAPAEYTTRRCVACGHTMEYNQADELSHRCERCGDERDQDYTAALNLLGLAEAMRAATDGCSQTGPQGVEDNEDKGGADEEPAQGLGC